MPYVSDGMLTTNEKQISVSGGWATQTEWSNYQSLNNLNAENGVVTLSEIQYNLISDEEDGDLVEWTGDIGTGGFEVSQSPVVPDSSYSISFSTDGTVTYVENSFPENTYSAYRAYVYPESANNEIMFVDTSNGNVVFGIYFHTGTDVITFAGSAQTAGEITNSGPTSRTGGTTLVSGLSNQWYAIELLNIDWQAETVDIAVDGTIVATDEPFVLSGVPDLIQLNSNAGSGTTAGYTDQIGVL